MTRLRAWVAEALYALADRLDPPEEPDPELAVLVKRRMHHAQEAFERAATDAGYLWDEVDRPPCGQPWDGVCPERIGRCCAEVER